MKAAILRGARDIHCADAGEPEISPGQVLVRSVAAGVCGTDLHIYRGEFHDRVKFPAVLGHEFGGEIVEVGRSVKGWRVGDRVTVDPIIPCRACPPCVEGHINACCSLKLVGIDVSGGFGQYVAAPQENLYRLPEGVPLKHAPMVEMYGLGHHILRRGRVDLGESVVILGAGRLGLSVLDVLCHGSGSAETMVVDIAPFRLETARKLGAEHCCDATKVDPVEFVLEQTQGVGADCVIECVGHYQELPEREAPLAQAVKMIRNGGRIVTAGLGEQLSSVHFKTLVFKEAEIIGSRVTTGEFSRALRLMGKGLLHPELLITHESPIEQVADAFAKVDTQAPEVIKIVLDMGA
jgi:2-desacetyl-2-hydroxyethyl bacteriochlorophyllide A dehydrogenase